MIILRFARPKHRKIPINTVAPFSGTVFLPEPVTIYYDYAPTMARLSLEERNNNPNDYNRADKRMPNMVKSKADELSNATQLMLDYMARLMISGKLFEFFEPCGHSHLPSVTAKELKLLNKKAPTCEGEG